MSPVRKVAAAIVLGGLSLGALLGAAAHPVMQRMGDETLQLSARPGASDYDPEQAWIGDQPVYPSLPASYRPDLDYDTFVSADWAPPQGWASYEEGGSYEYVDEDPLTGVPQGPDAALASKSADAAIDAAADAQLAASEAPTQAAPVERDVTRSGLY